MEQLSINTRGSGETNKKLVVDILDTDRKTLDCQKIIFLLWEHKDDEAIVHDLLLILSSFTNEKKILLDIEFYLPQLVHSLIHFAKDLKSFRKNNLQFVKALSVKSTTLALQFNYIVKAYLEDYQAEVADGGPNGIHDPVLYHRCALLLQAITRAVIYGKGHESGKALPPQEDNKEVIRPFDQKKYGWLLFKRSKRKPLHGKSWKRRYFAVQNGVLSCYHSALDVRCLRSMLLASCDVVIIKDHPKYGSMCFDIVDTSNSARFHLQAESEEIRDAWIERLRRYFKGVPPPMMTRFPSPTPHAGSRDTSLTDDTFAFEDDEDDLGPVGDRKIVEPLDEAQLNKEQRIRYRHFQQQIIYTTNLTNMCERLRFLEPSLRKTFLRRDLEVMTVPPMSYIPLNSAGDATQVILQAVHSEARAFTTKARCPALCFFEMEEHPGGRELADFLEIDLPKMHESDVVIREMVVVPSESTTEESVSVAATTEEAKASSIATSSATSVYDGSHYSDALAPTETSWRTDKLDEVLGKLDIHAVEIMKATSLAAVDVSDVGVSVKGVMTVGSSRVSGALPVENPCIGETFEDKAKRLRSNSPYGVLPGWKLGGFIAKSNDDLRQEVFVMQCIMYYQRAFREAALPAWLYTYKILSTSQRTGLIQLIPNAVSLDGLKKSESFRGNLRLYFENTYGKGPGGLESPTFKAAMNNYVSSLAAYSIVSYLLGIKDRHNGNVMIDTEGHLIHIDFGFVFGLAPGKAFSMERCAFKLTHEFADVMGGRGSGYFKEYERQCAQNFIVARKHFSQVSKLLEIMCSHSTYPAFLYNPHAVSDFEAKLCMDQPDSKVVRIVEGLIEGSYGYAGTDLYDDFQVATNGIAK